MGPGPRSGLVHLYTSRLAAFEHSPTPPTASPKNLIIFVGGLYDGLITVPYTRWISNALPPTWSLANVLLSSSYTGWGTRSLQSDVKELAKCVAYFRSIGKEKIVIMGHSTGCQDVMEYLTGKGHETREKVDGGIIQAPTSDREAILASIDHLPTYHEGCKAAKSMIEAGDGDEILHSKFTTSIGPAPVSARRWLSLASPDHDGDDDYFSSDLTDEQLLKSFGALPPWSPLCVLFSGSDEYVPSSIDKDTLLQRWIGIVKQGEGVVDEVNSGIVEGATHNLARNKDEVIEELVKRVLEFVSGLSAHSNL